MPLTAEVPLRDRAVLLALGRVHGTCRIYCGAWIRRGFLVMRRLLGMVMRDLCRA
jgi:hypothetical protein